MSSAVARVIVAVIFIPIIILVLYLGNIYFLIFISVLIAAGIVEMHGISRKKSVEILWWLAVPFGVAFACIMHWAWTDYLLIWLFLFILLAMAIELFYRRTSSPLLNIGMTVFSTLYVAALMSSLIWLRNLHTKDQEAVSPGFEIVVFILTAIWSCDTLAYYGGMLMGRHKLYEAVSPKKTWEGAVSGFFGSLGGVLLVQWILELTGARLYFSVVQILVIGGLAGTLGQVGDLAESLLKRDAGVKDSGALIPGHGGILDRFDSLLFVAPAVYIYVKLFVL